MQKTAKSSSLPRKQVKISSKDLIELKKIQRNFKRKKSDEEIFYNLCFCIMAPQTTFISNKRAINDLIGMDFYHNQIDAQVLEFHIKKTRFYRNKTRYLLEAKERFPEILSHLRGKQSAVEKREYLVKNVRGLGYKVASHLLRNLGETNLSVIDTHILKFMGINKLPSTKNRYLEIEEKFCDIALYNNLSPAMLDAWIWKVYSKTNYEDFDY